MLCIHTVMTLQSRVYPFGNLRIKVCSQLPEAYRSVLRPSSPLNAKPSTKRPFHTLLNSQTFFIQKRVKIKFVIKYKYHLILIKIIYFSKKLFQLVWLVEADGIEPTTYSLQSYRSPNWATPPILVGQGGLEPPTPRLSSVCSNQLSY